MESTPRTTITLPKLSSCSASFRRKLLFRESLARSSLIVKVSSFASKLPIFHYQLSAGELRHIHKLRYWPLEDVLNDKYLLPKPEADVISSFLTPMLRLDPDRRAKASELSHHTWLDGIVVQGEIDQILAAERKEEERRQAEADAAMGASTVTVTAPPGANESPLTETTSILTGSGSGTQATSHTSDATSAEQSPGRAKKRERQEDEAARQAAYEADAMKPVDGVTSGADGNVSPVEHDSKRSRSRPLESEPGGLGLSGATSTSTVTGLSKAPKSGPGA